MIFERFCTCFYQYFSLYSGGYTLTLIRFCTLWEGPLILPFNFIIINMYIVSDKKKENPGLLQLEIFQQVKEIKTVSQDLCRDEEERERLGRRI